MLLPLAEVVVAAAATDAAAVADGAPGASGVCNILLDFARKKRDGLQFAPLGCMALCSRLLRKREEEVGAPPRAG